VDGLKLTQDMVQFKTEIKTISGQNITPHVIEPSFGIGRIIYCILEHTYWTREGDEQRGVLSLPPHIAPVKCSIFPLTQNKDFVEYTSLLAHRLATKGISNKLDDIGVSIGRRYARTDEIGIPFGVTVDFDTLKDKTVTLRHRDSTQQIRVPIDNVPDLVDSLVKGDKHWSNLPYKLLSKSTGES